MPARNRAWTLAAVLWFALGAVYFTQPLVRHMNRGLPYSACPMRGWETLPLYQGDHLQQYFHYWMAYDYLATGGNFFADPYEFRCGDTRIFTTRRLLMCLPFVPLAWALGPVAAYNLLSLLAVFLAGLGLYGLARRFWGHAPSALAAGTLFAFSPYSLGQLLGAHTNGFLTWMLPCLFLACDRLLETGRARYAAGALFILVTFACMEYHLLYYTGLCLPAFLLLRLFALRVQGRTGRALRGAALLATAGLVSLVIMFTIHHIEIRESTEKAGRSLSEVALNSPAPADLLKRNTLVIEKNIYLGLAGTILTALACLRLVSGLWRHRRNGAVRLLACYGLPAYLLALFAGGIVLSLGTSVHWPFYSFCYWHLPYFKFFRVPARLFVLAAMAAALLAGWALQGLSARLRRGRRTALPAVLCLLCAAATVADLRPDRPVGISLLPAGNAIYDRVKASLAPGQKVLMLPLWPGDAAWSSVYQYYVSLYRIPMLNGYYPIAPAQYHRQFFLPMFSINTGFITQDQHRLLLREQVRFLIFHQDAFPQKVSHYPANSTVERLLTCPYLEYLAGEHGVHLFQVLDEPRPILRQPDPAVSSAGIYFENTSFQPRAMLAADPDASNGSALRLLRESAAPVHATSGRKQVLAPGAYRVSFRMRTNRVLDSASPVAKLSVVNSAWGAGDAPLLVRNLRASDLANRYSDVVLELESPKPFQPEFRIDFTPGAADLYLDDVYMVEASQTDPLRVLEAENTFTSTFAWIERDPRAGGGRAVAIDLPGHPPTMIECVFGPYRRFPEGRYRLRAYLKALDVSGPEARADLEITTDWGRTLLASAAQTWNAPGTGYQPVETVFTLTRPQVLEFRVIYRGECSLRVDRFEIDPLPAETR